MRKARKIDIAKKLTKIEFVELEKEKALMRQVVFKDELVEIRDKFWSYSDPLKIWDTIMALSKEQKQEDILYTS